jgi:hypothetical protein
MAAIPPILVIYDSGRIFALDNQRNPYGSGEGKLLHFSSSAARPMAVAWQCLS